MYKALATSAFSSDGRSCTLHGSNAYTTVVTTADGANHSFFRRQRPHILFDGSGTPPMMLFSTLTQWGDPKASHRPAPRPIQPSEPVVLCNLSRRARCALSFSSRGTAPSHLARRSRPRECCTNAFGSRANLGDYNGIF